MNAIREVLRAVVAASDDPMLPRARLLPLVYLVDWEAAQTMGRPLTGVPWHLEWSGPYAEEVLVALDRDRHLQVRMQPTVWGDRRIVVADALPPSLLDPDAGTLVQRVVAAMKPKGATAFLAHVKSTYPCVYGTRGRSLDLVALARAQAVLRV